MPIKVYDTGGNRRNVKTAYVYDVSGNRRNVKTAYTYDIAGNRQKIFDAGGGAAGSGQILYSAGGVVRSRDPIFFTVPPGVTQIHIAAVGGGGGGWRSFGSPTGVSGGGGGLAWASLAVTPGQVFLLRPGIGGAGSNVSASVLAGEDSEFRQGTTVLVRGGGGGPGRTGSPGAGGTGLIASPAVGSFQVGGIGSIGSIAAAGGGGGAAGYTGVGGAGTNTQTGGAGQGGGAGGGAGYGNAWAGGGGGIRLDGAGASGAGGSGWGAPGGGGSSGNPGTQGQPTSGGQGGRWGGGGAGAATSSGNGATGAHGAIEVRWGDGAAYPAARPWYEYTGDFTITPGNANNIVYGVSRTFTYTGASGGPFYPAVRNGSNFLSLTYTPGTATYAIGIDGLMTDPGSNQAIADNYVRGIQIDGIGDVLVTNGQPYQGLALDGFVLVSGIAGLPAIAPGVPYTCRFIY